MKTAARLLLTVFVLICAASPLMASGPVGIYGIVSKVVMEPNEKAPERIQIWGAFTLVDGGVGSGGNTLTPQRGYLYFKLTGTETASQKEAALKEWADFKAIAGTGQAVAFGQLGYIGGFTDELISRPSGNPPYILMPGEQGTTGIYHAENPVRPESAAPSKPSVYPLNMGLTRLASTGNLAAVVKKLEQALKR